MSINIDVGDRSYSLRIRKSSNRYSLRETAYRTNIHGSRELVHTRLLYVSREREGAEDEMRRRANQLRRASEAEVGP